MLYPQRGRTQLLQIIAAYIQDNALQQITPANVRRVLREIVSSDWNRADDGTGTGGGSGVPIVLADYVTLQEAQGLQNNPNPAAGVQPGVLYIVAGSSTKQWNAGTASETVFVDGLANTFASTGWRLLPTGKVEFLTVDIAAGTYVKAAFGAPLTAYQLDKSTYYTSPALAAIPIASLRWLHLDRSATAVQATYPTPGILAVTNRPFDGAVLAYVDSSSSVVPVATNQPGAIY